MSDRAGLDLAIGKARQATETRARQIQEVCGSSHPLLVGWFAKHADSVEEGRAGVNLARACGAADFDPDAAAAAPAAAPSSREVEAIAARIARYANG